jgi:hypothetical protein
MTHECGDVLHVYQFPSRVCKCGREPVPKGILRHYDHSSHILTRLVPIFALLLLMGFLMLMYIAIGGRV